jgi:hypothetical protein
VESRVVVVSPADCVGVVASTVVVEPTVVADGPLEVGGDPHPPNTTTVIAAATRRRCRDLVKSHPPNHLRRSPNRHAIHRADMRARASDIELRPVRLA